MYSSQEIWEKYRNFYVERGHVEIPNTSLIPEGDSSLLFVNSGMFPLVPYLMGEPHPMGTRLVNIQRCLRFGDMEEVGDNRHTTAFHMLGNWSLNDYFKEEQLPWVYEFIFDVLGLSPERVYSTVFAGNDLVPRDDASAQILERLYIDKGLGSSSNSHIHFLRDNWWQRGDGVGELGGPDSEIFYYVPDDASQGFGLSLEEHEDSFLEIGNSVFLQYVQTESGWHPMDRHNVDFGGGLERLALVVQGKQDIFETDNFWPVVQLLEELTGSQYKSSEEVTRHMRILVDHLRSSVFISMDGVLPSNKDQGYVLRRLLRRLVRSARVLGLSLDVSTFEILVSRVVETLIWLYPDLSTRVSEFVSVFSEESLKFEQTLRRASKEVKRLLEAPEASTKSLSAWVSEAFKLYQSFGYPVEDFLLDIETFGLPLDEMAFKSQFDVLRTQHKQRSRQGSLQKFKGGLADASQITTKYHTLTHLLQVALEQVLGFEVSQLGSNLTQERLRFDFNLDRTLSDNEVALVESKLHEFIGAKLPVKFEVLPKATALALGAKHLTTKKYGDPVKVYYIGDSLDTAISKEFCGGPHVSNTAELSSVRLYKQKKIGQNTLRVYLKFV